MQIHYKEKAILANRYKIERAERSKNWIGHNLLNVVLFGIFISIVGPTWIKEPSMFSNKKPITALEMSDFGYIGTVIYIVIWYTGCIIIAYFAWKYQDERKIKKLKKQRMLLLSELEFLKLKEPV